MTITSTTPIIVGVGQFTEQLKSPSYKALSAPDIAAEASLSAIRDAASVGNLLPHIDAIFTTRTFEDSNPMRAQPFGKSNNFPRSVAQRVGINPKKAIWGQGGGDSPQKLVNEVCSRLATGEFRVVLVTGAENISTARWLQSEGKQADWSESVEGEVENRGTGLHGLVYRYNTQHGLIGTPPTYGLCETARRKNLGQNSHEYLQHMGRLFAPFTKVAADNPFSSSAISPMTAEDLITVGERNRLISSPYPQRLVARDQVNQGAALVITTVGNARALGIPEHRWVYLHGRAAVSEREVLQRQDLGKYPAAILACNDALRQSGISARDIKFFDFYSCYPIAVSSVAVDGLGVHPDDPRGFTVTGGLPYFGGPGNNYSMHAISTMVDLLRSQPGTYGLVGANGGYLSKYAVGIYSTRPVPLSASNDDRLQEEIDNWPAPTKAEQPTGWATIESYTVVYAKGIPDYAVVVGRTKRDERFLARTEPGDESTLASILKKDALGQQIYVRALGKGNRFTFNEERMNEILPEPKKALRKSYQHVLIERRGHLLLVTINRPDVRNSIHPMANEELAEIWDAFEADDDLWLAILTGAGTEAFSAGNDLKYTASGKPSWMPLTGFGGLTKRVRTKPIIAAVNGYAMGGGMEMALACDIVVADERASFALSEVKVGVVAACNGLVRLPHQLPRKIAMEHILTGRKIDVRKAEKFGLVNRVTSAGQAMAGALEIAQEILEVSPTSVRVSMKMINEADSCTSLNEALARNSKHLDELLTSEDFQEGPKAFSEKRQPIWKNR